MKDKTIESLRKSIYFVGAFLVHFVFIFVEIPYLEERTTLKLLINIGLLLLVMYGPDFIFKRMFPDYFRKLHLKDHDERAQTIKGKTAVSTLNFTLTVALGAMFIAVLMKHTVVLDYMFMLIIIISLYYKIAHMSYEEKL